MLDGAFTNFVFALVVLLYAKLPSSEKKERYHDELTSREQKKGTAMYE